MDKILEELWYGNINPQESDLSNTPEIKEITKNTARHRENLERTLSDEQKELLTQLTDSMYDFERIYELEIFKYAFKLGARITAESLFTDNQSGKI